MEPTEVVNKRKGRMGDWSWANREPRFHYPFIESHLGWLYILAVVNRVAMNVTEQLSLENNVKTFGHMPNPGIAGLFGIFTLIC